MPHTGGVSVSLLANERVLHLSVRDCSWPAPDYEAFTDQEPSPAIRRGRDENGVPHISAGSFRSALYGLGFLHAVDRPTQMLFGHAVASGRSAERIADKPELLETDRFFRRAGLYVNLDPEVHRLDDVTFGHLTAYCEGVNDGMKQYGRSLPMWATGFQLHPWNQQAVMLIGNLLSFGGLAVGQQQNEHILLELIQTGLERDKLRELFEPLLDNADFELLQRIKIANRLSDEALELLTDLPRLAGSNAWAVAPAQCHGRGAVGLGSASGGQSAAGPVVRGGVAVG